MAWILVIEDSESFVEYMRAVLGPAHTVDIARNGREAAKLVDRNHYDLVITDIFMPEADGIEALRNMREAAPGVPVIAMTGMDGNTLDFLAIAGRLGATRTIRKPFRPDEIRQLVADTLAGSPDAGRAAWLADEDSISQFKRDF